MPEATWTLIDEGTTTTVPAAVEGDAILLSGDALQSALGWELKPQGLCQGDVCVPVRDGDAVDGEGRMRLDAFAETLGRPLALDADENVAALGASAQNRADALATLQAPDFTLPDLAGKEHTLSHFRGKKILMVVYSSW